MLRSIHIDLLNIILMVVSLVIAILLPFQLFLLAYAILGPLHYLTEINWLHDKKYFVQHKNWLWIPCLFAMLVFLPKLLYIPEINVFWEDTELAWLVEGLLLYNNSFIFVWFVASIGLIVLKKRIHIWLLIALGIILAIALNTVDIYSVIVGMLIPTLIHVYLFTMLFMLYGALKNKSIIGYWSVVAMITCPLVIIAINLPIDNFTITEAIRATYVDSGFYNTNAQFARFIGLSDGSTFSFERILDIKIQMFFAFAYTYHYLNWFSKTTVIGWHRSLTTRRSLIIIAVWGVSVALYYLDYSIGLLVLLSLSFLHVFLEFPLNVLSIRGISEALMKRIQLLKDAPG